MSLAANISPATPDDIWNGDLFDRRGDAEALIAFIESVAGRPSLREDHRGFTLAVDAEYGTGKSYFLRRLARHLMLTHPVAFVDAWSDDLSDDPLTAIAATLKKAMAPLTSSNEKVRRRYDEVSAAAGNVMKIAAKGLAKKGLGLLITDSAVRQLDGVLDGLADGVREDIEEDISDGAVVIGDSLVDGLSSKSGRVIMAQKIEDFENGQSAIVSLKASLRTMIDALPVGEARAPVVIIIDELDRCRPPYAIKLLEELKHLFDVPGIVFVLGLNSRQLTKSIQSAYGPDFDGNAYLRRFVDRHYSLPTPSLEPLLKYLFRAQHIDGSRLYSPPILLPDTEHTEISSPVTVVAKYMRLFGLTARDAFGVVDRLQTCLALVNGYKLLVPLLLPMIIAQTLNKDSVSQLQTHPDERWTFRLYRQRSHADFVDYSPTTLFHELDGLRKLSRSEMNVQLESGNRLANMLENFGPQDAGEQLEDAAKYDVLLRRVGFFENPEQALEHRTPRSPPNP